MRVGIATLFLTSFLSVATQPASAQCDDPQGNASLATSGIPEIGGNLRLAIHGEPGESFLVVAASTVQPVNLPGGTFCLGGGGRRLLGSTFFTMPINGTFVFDLTVPDNAALIGQTVYFQGIVGNPGAPAGQVAITNLTEVTFIDHLPVQTIFFDDYEAGLGSWFATNGLWQVGAPTSGPGAAYSGVNAAATLLAGNYPDGQDSRLVSPLITLPNVGAGEQIRVNFRQWHSYGAGDDMRVQVSADNGQSFTTVACSSTFVGSGARWTQASADLTSYAGQTVRITFSTTTTNLGGGAADPGPGSFIDDVHVFHGAPSLAVPQTWEGGLGFWWSVSNGLWHVGVPASPGCLNGNVACTVLDGNYPDGQDSRLMSPPLPIPGTGFSSLRFDHWFSFGAGDSGVVQVSTDDGCSWTNASASFVGSSGGCTTTIVDMTPFSGQTVRLGFLINTVNLGGGAADPGPGWCVDDIRLE